jgi:hypothetical protein
MGILRAIKDLVFTSTITFPFYDELSADMSVLLTYPISIKNNSYMSRYLIQLRITQMRLELADVLEFESTSNKSRRGRFQSLIISSWNTQSL